MVILVQAAWFIKVADFVRIAFRDKFLFYSAIMRPNQGSARLIHGRRDNRLPQGKCMCDVEEDADGKRVQSWIAGVSGSFAGRSLTTVCSLQWHPSLRIQSTDERLDLVSSLVEAIRPYSDPALSEQALQRLAQKMAEGLLELYLFDDLIRRRVLEPLIRRQHDKCALSGWSQGRPKKHEIHAFAEWFASFWVNDLNREPVDPAKGLDSKVLEKAVTVGSPYCFVRDVLNAVKVDGFSAAADLVKALQDPKQWPVVDAEIRFKSYLLPPLPPGKELAKMIRGPLNKKLDELRLDSGSNKSDGASNPDVVSPVIDGTSTAIGHDDLQTDARPSDGQSGARKGRKTTGEIITCLDRSARTLRHLVEKCSDGAQARRLEMIAMALEGASLLER